MALFRLNHKTRASALLTVAALACQVLPLRAQSLNYGATEQLFGEPVTMSATGSPQRASDAAVSMEIITADEIRRSGAYDIPGVLRHVLGVSFQQWTNNQADIGLRGYDQPFSQRVLVLIDGRQVYADYYSFVPWSALPVTLEGIRQIEVVLGPGNALFGYNAAAGVINIVTYSPLYDDQNAASVRKGTQDLFDGSGIATLHNDRAGVRLMASAGSDSDFDSAIPPTMYQGQGRLNDRRTAVDLDGVARLTDTIEAQLQASRTQSDMNIFNPGYLLAVSRMSVSSVLGQLSADSPLGWVQLRTYTNLLTQLTTPTVDGQSSAISNRLNYVGLQDLFKPAASHSFRAALEYRASSADTTPITDGDVHYQTVSESLMWEWKLAPWITLTNAGRWDALHMGRGGTVPAEFPFSISQWNRNIDKASYDSSVVLKPDSSDTLRVVASKGLLLPNLINLGALVVNTPTFGVTGSPLLHPTIVTNYEVGWDRTLAPIAASLRVRIYRQVTDNLVSLTGGGYVFAPGTYYPYALPSSTGTSTANGMEIGVDGTFQQSWRWGLNVEFEHVKDRFPPQTTGGIAYLDYEDSTPESIINANIGYTRGRWQADLYGHFESETSQLRPAPGMSYSQSFFFHPFFELEVRLGYQITSHATLALSGQNLLHAEQAQTSGPAVERRILGRFTYTFKD
jgi:outer membrane receptor for ferrienterochelin and colicins